MNSLPTKRPATLGDVQQAALALIDDLDSEAPDHEKHAQAVKSAVMNYMGGLDPHWDLSHSAAQDIFGMFYDGLLRGNVAKDWTWYLVMLVNRLHSYTWADEDDNKIANENRLKINMPAILKEWRADKEQPCE